MRRPPLRPEPGVRGRAAAARGAKRRRALLGAPGLADGAVPGWRDGPPPATLEAMTRHVRAVAWAVVALLVLALAASLVLEALV